MKEMFNDYLQFNRNMETWNVSKVETMEGMFDSNVYFDQPFNGVCYIYWVLKYLWLYLFFKIYIIVCIFVNRHLSISSLSFLSSGAFHW
jgi:hypothetical protein